MFFWKLGLFDFTGAEASVKVIAATLALFGALIGSIVTVVGSFLKHSIDQRNAELKEREQKRLEIESERNMYLHEDAEKRLKLETAIQAVNLLSTSSGEDVPITQKAGVLFTLANLGQADLAIDLAGQMAGESKIDAITVNWLIERSLLSNDEATQNDACTLLSNVASNLFVVGDEKLNAWFPYCLLEWDVRIPSMVRRSGLLSLLNQMVSQPYSKWETGYIAKVIICLATTWVNDEDEPLKNSIGICLEKILDIFQVPEKTDYWTRDGNWIGIHSIEKQVRGLSAKVKSLTIMHAIIAISKQIEDWGLT